MTPLSPSAAAGCLIAVVAAPYRSLAAPYEAAFLINDFLRKRDVPAKVDVATAESRPIPAADHEVGDRVAATLERRDIGFQPDRLLESVDPAAREARFTDGSEPFDLLIAVPPHRAPGFIAVSPLAGPNGWIRAEPFSLSVRSNVHAIGDVTEIELAGGARLPKAGVLAQAEAAVVADNIATTAAGYRPRSEFEGSLDYYLDWDPGAPRGQRGTSTGRRAAGCESGDRLEGGTATRSCSSAGRCASCADVAAAHPVARAHDQRCHSGFPEARPTGFEPVTFGFVDRVGSSVELVWARDSALDRDSSSSGFGWTPSRLLPFCCPRWPPASAEPGRFVRPGTAALVVGTTRR